MRSQALATLSRRALLALPVVTPMLLQATEPGQRWFLPAGEKLQFIVTGYDERGLLMREIAGDGDFTTEQSFTRRISIKEWPWPNAYGTHGL